MTPSNKKYKSSEQKRPSKTGRHKPSKPVPPRKNAKMLEEYWKAVEPESPRSTPPPGQASDSPRLSSSRWNNELKSQNCSLLSLPVEVRELIWKLALLNPDDCIITPSEIPRRGSGMKWKFRSGVPGDERHEVEDDEWEYKFHAWDAIVVFNTLSLTCRQTYIEIVERGLLYSLHRFNFFYPQSAVRFLGSLPEGSRDAIKDITVTFVPPVFRIYREGGEKPYRNLVATEVLEALWACKGLKRVTFTVGTSLGNRFYAEMDYTGQGEIAIGIVQTLATRLEQYGLSGLSGLDIQIWDPHPWQREAEDLVMVGSGNWTAEVKECFGVGRAGRRPVDGSVKDFWTDETKRKLEMAVENLRVQVTRPKQAEGI